jgi:hypothetical protein
MMSAGIPKSIAVTPSNVDHQYALIAREKKSSLPEKATSKTFQVIQVFSDHSRVFKRLKT